MNDIEGLQRQIDGLAKLLDDLNVGEQTAIACAVYNSTDFSHNSSGNWLAVTFNSERRDVLGMHSTSVNTDRVTFALGGWYLITGHFVFASNSTGLRGIRVYGGGASIAETYYDAVASTSTGLSIAALYYFAATNYVELQAYQNSGGTLAITAAAAYSPELRVIRLP